MQEIVLWRDHLTKQEASSELNTENWVLSQVMQSNEKYEIVESSQKKKENLLKNQKMSSSEVINEIQSLEKEYSSELWDAIYRNILDTLYKEVISVEYEKRILLLWWQIIFMNQEIIRAVKF